MKEEVYVALIEDSLKEICYIKKESFLKESLEAHYAKVDFLYYVSSHLMLEYVDLDSKISFSTGKMLLQIKDYPKKYTNETQKRK